MEIRKRLGITQQKFSSILGVSRSYIAMGESGVRNFNPSANTLLSKIFLQFLELENGKQSAYRTLETNLFLNAEYRKKLPQMKKLEKEYRQKAKDLTKQLDKMKESARNAEHSIIVLTRVIDNIKEENKQGKSMEIKLTGLSFLKEECYLKLLRCWEPEQAKLLRRIAAIKGEARALQKYREQVIKEHNPFKRKKRKIIRT